MDPRHKHKGVLFCIHQYYKNTCINENNDNVIKKMLERYYKNIYIKPMPKDI